MKPSEWRIMEMLGVCYYMLQNLDETEKWYKATLKLNPNSDIAKKGLRRISRD
jgi:Flp pilus assembly protein TadD